MSNKQILITISTKINIKLPNTNVKLHTEKTIKLTYRTSRSTPHETHNNQHVTTPTKKQHTRYNVCLCACARVALTYATRAQFHPCALPADFSTPIRKSRSLHIRKSKIRRADNDRRAVVSVRAVLPPRRERLH